MLRGIVIKLYNGYYYVQNEEKLVMCTLRGRLKKNRFSLLVGDNVEFSPTGTDKGVIENILPRRSMLKRPMVANVDQVILTFAAANPDLNLTLLDRFLVLAELSHLQIIICINKVDLADSERLDSVFNLYQGIGYKVVLMSAKSGIGTNEIMFLLSDSITVFAGPSGVGKSTILNAIEPGLRLETGSVSKKLGRGKHTTRFAQLLPLSGGGYVVDTPGFSFTDFHDIQETKIADCFPEISVLAPECKYSSCLHYKEPQCVVKQAVGEGKIASQRYTSYIELLEEIRKCKKGF